MESWKSDCVVPLAEKSRTQNVQGHVTRRFIEKSNYESGHISFYNVLFFYFSKCFGIMNNRATFESLLFAHAIRVYSILSSM